MFRSQHLFCKGFFDTAVLLCEGMLRQPSYLDAGQWNHITARALCGRVSYSLFQYPHCSVYPTLDVHRVRQRGSASMRVKYLPVPVYRKRPQHPHGPQRTSSPSRADQVQRTHPALRCSSRRHARAHMSVRLSPTGIRPLLTAFACLQSTPGGKKLPPGPAPSPFDRPATCHT